MRHANNVSYDDRAGANTQPLILYTCRRLSLRFAYNILHSFEIIRSFSIKNVPVVFDFFITVLRISLPHLYRCPNLKRCQRDFHFVFLFFFFVYVVLVYVNTLVSFHRINLDAWIILILWFLSFEYKRSGRIFLRWLSEALEGTSEWRITFSLVSNYARSFFCH